MKIFSSFLCCLILWQRIDGAPLQHKLDSTQCKTCSLVVEVAHDLLGEETLDDCIVDFITFVCSALSIEDHFVCKGMVSDFKDTFIYVLNELIVEPKEICGLLIKDCDGGFDPYNATWFLPMPGVKPPHKEPTPVPSGKPILRVLQLSDLHVDNDYVVGLEAKCGEPLCCRPPKDIHEAFSQKDVAVPAGKWGTVGDCDAPYWLLEDMMKNIAAKHQDIDYVVISGDLESHADWDYTKEGHIEKVRNISRVMKQFLPGKQVYFAIGNHEGVPIDNFAPHFTPQKFHMDFLYNAMAEEWKDWLPADQLASVQFNGCYMKKLFPGLRLISLNNALGDAVNFYLYINQTDPDGTMTWLLEQLEDAERNGDKVHIVAHIGGGDGEALEGWAINYYNAVNRYEDTISAQFFGHTHSEEYYVVYEDPENPKSRPTSVVYAAPSLTPYSEFNPAYRIYTIDGNYEGSSYRVIDFEEYFLNLTVANANPDAPTNWESLYSSAKAEYGLSEISPAEWNKLIDRMLIDDNLFAKYYKNKYRRNGKTCGLKCKLDELCSIRQAHHSNNLCNDLQSFLARSGETLSTKKDANLNKIKSSTNVVIKNKEEAKKLIGKTILPSNDKCKI